MSTRTSSTGKEPHDFNAFLEEIKAELYQHTETQSKFYNFDFELIKPSSKPGRFSWEKED